MKRFQKKVSLDKMAARLTSAFYHFTLILHLFLLIHYNYGERFGDDATTLYINEERENWKFRRSIIINKENEDHFGNEKTSFSRIRRDISEHSTTQDTLSQSEPNITSKVNVLNDSHQQLMVHWVGEGSNVIICLARDSSSSVRSQGARLPVQSNPSAVYISYDYGDSFENKTELFKISDNPVQYATLDKFYTHPKFNTYCVFADSANSVIFITNNNGKNITQVTLHFHPSEISFYEDNPNYFVALDKISPHRILWLTSDMGKTWRHIHQSVKSFFWSSLHPKSLLIERQYGRQYSCSVVELGLRIGDDTVKENASSVIENVEDFQIRRDYMFATRKRENPQGKTSVLNESLDLWISYKNQAFVLAQFNTELETKNFHIVDVSYDRIFVAVSHSETHVNLYVSEVIDDSVARFTLSLEGIMTFFPNVTWKNSWLNEVAEEPFTDLYKVEGLRGIYIASHVKETPKEGAISPEHLESLITYDHGVTWTNIKPPIHEHENRPHPSNWSLHLSQRFSQLFPVTRSISIMSSKSAPGIIMATGVMGSSLKGHPSLYVSRDAGLTWTEVLKDFYFFNIGDHGGVLVAVKYFKSRGEIRDILFSTDEGKLWQAHRFNDEMLRIYGLMTEPGENTTVFTMFGSNPGQHKWLIIKVDLRKAFQRECTLDDFKFWSPYSADQPGMTCVLGRKEVYQRRAQNANCYIGVDYDRPVKSDICPCDFQDYECDFGFVKSGNPFTCIRESFIPSQDHSGKLIRNYDPFKIPSTCVPGQFYNRTKGYRKISDDECTGGLARRFEPQEIPCPMKEPLEFILVAQREHISRIDLRTQNHEILPVHDLKNVIAIEYDMENDCLYWADIVNDSIGRQCFKSGTSYPEILVETDLSSIEGMAYDWVSKVLYFVDGVKMRIQIIRTDINYAGRMRKTILGSNNLTKPRGIAVHPMNGYMFWTDWAPGNASVSRANLDGTNIKRLFTEGTVQWPNGITIDFISERIYWVDAREDYIGSSDYEGKRFKKIISNDERVSHAFAIAVFKDYMYWDDWKQSMIFVADKEHGAGIATALGMLTGLMDLKVFAHSVQTGTNKCANNTCTHICLGTPNNSYVCLCPDGMEMHQGKCLCPNAVQPLENSTCPRVANTCAPNQFACKTGVCVPELWRCDGDNDCGDNADEENCKRSTCSPNSFECDGDKCIPRFWLCDLDKDCHDGKDEMNCTYSNCTESQFKCGTGRCIPHRWQCDGENDCHDDSDEYNCTKNIAPNTCKAEEIVCNNDHMCVPRTWQCDDELDCEDGSDEKDCINKECYDWQFPCGPKGALHRCIYKSWVCDGDLDCHDGSDEVNCTISTTEPPLPPILPTNSCNDWMFRCDNGKCMPYWWKCDSVNDCGDASDEIGCRVPDGVTDSVFPTEQTKQPRVCRERQFQCYDSQCVDDAWICDGTPDCKTGEDELHCERIHPTCREDQFMCRTDGNCIPLTNICNGIEECPDRSDELGCHPDQHPSPAAMPSCSVGFYPCDGNRCLTFSTYCDGKQDCFDNFDEKNCEKNNTRIYQAMVVGVDERSTNATTLSIFWWMPIPTNVTFEFLPSIAPIEPDAKWTNATSWTEGAAYHFDHLQPYTSYNLTVYVRVKGYTIALPSVKYYVGKTAEGIPSEPWDVAARQKNGTRIEVSWRPPLSPNGAITKYELYMTPPIPPTQTILQKTSYIYDLPFEANKNYSFWVIARNREHQSKWSNVATITFDGSANIDMIEDLKVVDQSTNGVTLSWKSLKDVDAYHVTPRAPPPYPAHHALTFKAGESEYKIEDLAPGIQYTFEVNAVKKNYIGRISMITATTKGTPLPSVLNFAAESKKLHGTTVKLSWDPPKDSRKYKWQYAIHYALNMPDLFDSPKLLTTNLTASIKDLEACESYIFAVGVRGKYGPGPLTQPVTVPTYYNVRAPPKHLRVTSSQKIDTIIVSWSSSCTRIDDPINYTITVTDMIMNKTSSVTTPPTNETVIKTTFKDIKFGGKYRITIATDVDDAIQSQPIIYLAPPLNPPHQVEVLPNRDKYFVFWQQRGMTEEMEKTIKYHYEVLVNENSRTINETSAKIYKCEQPPFIFNDTKPSVMYTFAVRLVTEEGYQSILSEIYSVDSPSVAEWPVTINTSNILSVAIPICLLIIALGAGLAYFVVRHRRLSNSFTQFANSHYDTRRGQATFPGTTDALDEEDSPVIRGFSDDEPLVIA